MCLAVPGKLVRIEPGTNALWRRGRVSFGGVLKDISLACLPEAKIGDYLLVHAGFAISVIDPQAAERSLGYLEEMAGLEQSGDETG